MAQGLVRYIAQLDQEIIEKLGKAGFKTNMGFMDTGIGGLVGTSISLVILVWISITLRPVSHAWRWIL